jgi:protease-4
MMENQTNEKPKKTRNRSALWMLFGLITGFGLPVLACLAFFFMFVLGLSALSSGAGAGGPPIPVHVSGPLTGPAIAIVEINGPIIGGRAPVFNATPLAASENLIQVIRQTAKDPDVKVILLKVNSPGGSVGASDQIYQELKETRLPIVVLMGELAASGGYYVSMAGEHLIANPNSLVGSIGVISTFPNAEELFEKARRGEIQHVAGVDTPYEEPLKPEVLLNTDQSTVEQCVHQVMATLEVLGYIPRVESSAYTPEEEAMIRPRLQDLGYL